MVGVVELAALLAVPEKTAVVEPELWSAPPISSDQFESHPAFDPLTGDLWFVRSTPQFRGWRIKLSRCSPTGWTTPVDAPIAGDGVEADPWFTPNGRAVWFISTRSDDGTKRRGLDIWRATRDRHGHWSAPRRLPEPVNSAGQEWFPRIGRDGWLYFGSDRQGGYGRTDIWRARKGRAGRWTVENAGPTINSADDEYEALPDPRGLWLLIATTEGYYRSEKGAVGWKHRARMGPAINVNGSEIGAAVSPSGRSWLFSRKLDEARSGEILRVGGREAWPKPCPRHRAR
jgi:hypothetical protein